ncbi:MAG: PorT family protein [Bacteroidales bacterium]|jgi:hypothetical protein|nr:PorT family protein [Bacteroidales bacterium]
MKKLFIIAIALLASVTMSNAQKVNNFGVRAGVNISRITGDYGGYDPDYKYKAGFQVGVVDQIRFSESTPLFVETGLMFQQKGGKCDVSVSTPAVDMSVKINEFYLEVPALLGYDIPAGDNITLQPFAGLYYGLGIAGKTKLSGTSHGVTIEEKVDSFGDDGFKRSDFGLRVGAGVVISNFYLGVGFERGFLKINRDEGKVKNQSFTFNLGYNF